MRKKLAESFDEIYILNLHGNSLIGETTPDGGKDENVFDIRQGVAIALFVKTGNKKDKLAKVFYEDLYGLRGDIDKKDTKYYYLWNNNVKTTEWQELDLKKPQYFFIKKDYSKSEDYKRLIPLEDIFNKYTTGVKTHRDKFVIDFEKKKLEDRIINFISFDGSEDLIKASCNISNNDAIDIVKAKKDLVDVSNVEDLVVPLAYRPFDLRWICFHSSVIERHRLPLMASMLSPNLGLVSSRQFGGHRHFIVFVSDKIIEISSQPYAPYNIFPVYIYDGQEVDLDPQKQQSFLPQDQMSLKSGGKTVNFNQEFLDKIDRNLISPDPPKRKVSYEDIFYYIYAVLYSNVYRQKYEEFLKIDFPKIPFTKDYKLFKQLSDLGKELVDLHLLKSSELNSPTVKFFGRGGSGRVEKKEYISQDKAKAYWSSSGKSPKKFEKSGVIRINEKQFFGGVEPEVWNYQIGGYQVLDKWLKDRKDRTLNPDEIRHYCRVVTAIKETIKLQEEIDKLYPKVEEDLVN